MLLTSLANIIAVQTNNTENLLFINSIKEQIFSINSELIRQKIEKGNVHPNFVQTIKCAKVKKINSDECSFDLPELTILRTKNTIPRPIYTSKKEPLVTVYNGLTGLDRKVLPYKSIDVIQYSKYDKWTSNDPFYTYNGGHIYLINTPLTIPDISFRIIGDNPREVLKYSNKEIDCEECEDCISENCDNLIQSCFDINGDYVIEETISAQILTFFNNDRSSKKEEQ